MCSEIFSTLSFKILNSASFIIYVVQILGPRRQVFTASTPKRSNRDILAGQQLILAIGETRHCYDGLLFQKDYGMINETPKKVGNE